MRRSGWRLWLLREPCTGCAAAEMQRFCTAHSCWAICGLLLTRSVRSTACEGSAVLDFSSKLWPAGGLVGFSSGSSGAASKIIWTKTGHGTYLCLILIHTKFEKKS